MRMKYSLYSLWRILFFCLISYTTIAQSFWVGNTGNWSNVNNWANTSGGVGGTGVVPTSATDAIFDANSNGAGILPFTVTLDVPAATGTLNFTGIDAVLTMDGTNSLAVNGNVTTVANWNPTFTGVFSLAGATAATTNTINFTGQSFAGGVEVSATANTVVWQVSSGALTTTGAINLRRGTLDTNGQSVIATSISANDAGNQDRGLTLGASAVTLTGAGTVVDFTDNAATFTLNSGTSTVTMNNAAALTVIIGDATKTMPNLNFSVAGASATIPTSAVAANTISFGTISTTKTTFSVTGTGNVNYGGSVTLPTSVTANFGAGNATFATAISLPIGSTVNFNNVGTNSFATTFNAAATSTTTFANTVTNNTFTGAVTLGGTSATFNNTGTNSFGNTLGVSAGTITFGNTVTNNTFTGAVTLGGTSATFNNTGTNSFGNTLGVSAGIITFGNTVTNNTFIGAVTLGGTSATFGNTGTNDFGSTINVSTGTVAFSNNGTTYNGNVTLAAGTTWRFSGTGTSTVAASANFILNGSCVAAPANYVTVNANTGTANVTFVNSQTWANASVANLNVTGTVTVNQGSVNGGGNTNVTFSPTTATRTLFWVGGTGNWNNEANWSLTSGGAGGQCVPTINDDVVFDANSGAATFTTTLTAGAVCRSANFTGVNAMNLSGTNNWTVAGNLTLVANVTTTGFTGKLILDDNLVGVNTIIGAAKVFSGGIDFNSTIATPATASWQLATSGLGAAGTGTLALVNGTLNTNGQPVVCAALNANPVGDATRALTLGASAFTITGAGTAIDFRSVGNNLTLTAGTSTATMSNAGAITVETGNSSKTMPNLSFSGVGATATINLSSVAANTISFGTIQNSKTTLTVAGASSVAYGAAINLVANTTSTWGGNNVTFTVAFGLPNSNVATFSNTGTNTFNGTFTANAGAGSSLTFSNGGNNTFTGNVTLNAITKTINNIGTNSFGAAFTAAGTTTTFGTNVTNNTFTGAVNLTSTGAVAFNNSGNNTFNNTFTRSTATLDFNNTTGTNSFTGAVTLNSTTTTFANAANNFSSTIGLVASGVLNFNATTNNSFAGNVTAGLGSTINFSTRAGTSNTFTGTATIITNGNCSTPPTSFVKIQSVAAATQARLTFATAHTWANTQVRDINVVGGALITASAANADAGNNSGNISFTSSPTGTGRNLFWVGGTGNWSNPARWSLTSGGAGGECIPTIFDNVTFDANSGAAGYTVTLDITSPKSKSVTFATANAMTLAGAATVTWTVGGNFNMNNANVTQTGAGATFLGTILFTKSPNFPVAAQGEVSPATVNIGATPAARLFANITFNDLAEGSTGGAWTLTSAMNTIDPTVAASTNGYLQLLGGTLNTNGQTIRCRTFSASGTAIRTLTINSTIVVTGKDVDRTPTVDFSTDLNLTLSPTVASSFSFTNSQGGGGTVTVNTGAVSKTIPYLNYLGTFDNLVVATSNIAANTITLNQISVANNITNFSLSGNSQKVVAGTVTFSGTVGVTSDWSGNTTFNAGAVLTFANTAAGFTFNNTVTSAANINVNGNNSVLNFADTFTHNAGNTFAFVDGTTLNFNGTVNNTYAVLNGTGIAHTLNFNNTGNNTFTSTITVGTSSAVTFANTTDNNNFNANFTLGRSSTVRFSTNAGTSNTFAVGANLIPLGDCSNPTASYVFIRSTTNGTVARVTFGTAQTWNHVLVTDINNVLGQSVTVNALSGDGGNNTNIIFVSGTTGRTLYWSQRGGVAGTQNWSDPNSWSLSATGLPVGECPPTINDIVIVNDNSYTVNGNTMNIDVAAECRRMDWQIVTAARNPIVTNTLGIRIAENLILPATTVGANFSGINSTITFSATLAPTPVPAVAALIPANRIINVNGNTLPNANITINDTGVGVRWSTEQDLNIGATSNGVITLVQGEWRTLDNAGANARNITARRIIANGAANRILTFGNATGASIINVIDNAGATIFDISGSNITVNATNGGAAPFSTLNFTGDGTNTIELGTQSLSLGNFTIASTTAKALTVNTPTTPQTLTFNNIDVQTLTDITFNGTSPKTINNLTVRTPNTTIGFDMAGNTTVNGVVNFNTNVITRFRGTATFQTNADVVDFGANGVGTFDGLLTVAGRNMTFATSTNATIASLTTNAGMTFTNANLTFGNSANNTTSIEINNTGAATFTNGDINFGSNFNATFTGAATNNVFRDILTSGAGATNAVITFSNAGTNQYRNVTLRDGSIWRFSTSGTSSITGTFTPTASCANTITIRSDINGTCATVNFSLSQTWSRVNVLDLNSVGATVTVSSVSVGGACAATITNITTARTLYWRGNNNNWNCTTCWAASPAGPATECPPTINDDVFFDNLSFGAAGQSCTLTAQSECRSMTWTGVTNNPTFAMGTQELTIAGNLTFVAGMTVTGTTGRVIFNPASVQVIAPRTITMAGKTFTNTDGIYFRDLNATPSTWTLQDAFNTNSSILIAGGTLITNNNALTATLINANPNSGNPTPFRVTGFTRAANDIAAADRDRTRGLTLGSSTVTLTAAGTSTIMDFRGNTANFTLNAGTSQINLTNTGTLTIEMGSVAKNLYNLSQTNTTATTVNINSTSGTGTYGFNNVSFADNAIVNVNTPATAKTFNRIDFGNTTTSTFVGTTLFVSTTTTFGTATRTTVNPTTSATFTGLVTVGSTANAAGAADFQRSTFNGTPTSLTYTATTAGLFADTRFTTCTITNATSCATPNATMRFQGNNTFVPTTGTLTFANTSTPVTLQSNTANAGTQIFGGAVLLDAVAATGTANISLTGNTLFNNGLTVNSNTATATFGTTTANNTTIFKGNVSFNGNFNTITLNSVANELNGYVAFTDNFTIANAQNANALTTNGIVFFRSNVSIGNGLLTLVANNIVFNGRIDQRNAPANWGTSSTPVGAGTFTTTTFGTPTKAWTNGSQTDNTTGTSAGTNFTLGANNRVSFSNATLVDCGLRNLSLGSRTVFNMTNTGAGANGLHIIDDIILNSFVYFQIPARTTLPAPGLNPIIRVTNIVTVNPSCSEWVSISSVTSGLQGSFCFKINQNWSRVIIQDINVMPAACATGFAGTVAATNSQDAGNNTTVGTTITFTGTFGNAYFWMGGRGAAATQNNNWTNPENWSTTYPGYFNPTNCTPTAGDVAYFTNVSFPNNAGGIALPAAYGSFCDIDAPFVYIKDMIWVEDSNNNGAANNDTTGIAGATGGNVSGVYHTGANNMARLRNVNVPAATIEVYGRLKLPGGRLNQFTGTFSMQSAGLGGGTYKAIQNPKGGQFFGPLVFNAPDRWVLTENIDCNNNANGSITFNIGQLWAKGNNINLQGDFTINIPPAGSGYVQSQVSYNACGGVAGACSATVTFDGVNNNQSMSVAGVQGPNAPTTTTACDGTYDCSNANQNRCAVSPFYNLVVAKAYANPNLNINNYSITVNNNLTINTSSVLIDDGNQIRGNNAGNLTIATNAALRLGSNGTATVFPTCYSNNRINLSVGVNGALATQTLTNGGVATTFPDSTTNASIVEYLAGVSQLIRGRVTAVTGGSADTGAGMQYGTLIVSNGGGTPTAATKVYKDILNELQVNGSLIVRSGAVLRDMGFQITGNSNNGTGNRIRVEGAAQLYLGTGAAATTSTTYQPIINVNVANTFQTPTATANTATTFPTFTPIADIGSGGKMDLNNAFAGTEATSPTIDGVANGGANLSISAYSTVAYAANADQNVLAGFTYGNLALTNATALRIKTIMGAVLGTTTLNLGGSLLIQSNNELRDMGFQIIGNGNTDSPRGVAARPTRIRMEATSTLQLGITRAATTDVNTIFPTYATAGSNFTLGTPVANRNNNNRSLDAASTVIYYAGSDEAGAGISNRRVQRIDGGAFDYGNIVIANSAAPTGDKVLALRYVDSDGTAGTSRLGLAGNLTIGSYIYLYDNDCQIQRTGTGGVFTMQPQSALRIGGAFSTVGAPFATVTGGGVTSTFPTNFPINNNGTSLHISSTVVYGRAGAQNVHLAAATSAPTAATANTNFNYGSLVMLGSGTKTNVGNPFIAANLHINDNVTYNDGGFQIFGNATVSTVTSMPAVLSLTTNVAASAARNMTVTMNAGSVLSLGTTARLTTFPTDYPADRMGTTNLATTNTVIYTGGVTSATSANRRQIVASGFSYGNLIITNPSSGTGVSEKWVANSGTITTGASTSGAWTNALFGGTPPATVNTRVATGATVEVKNNFTINSGNMVYDDGTQINGSAAPLAATFQMLEAASAAIPTELYLGNATTPTIFPDRFTTINLTPNFSPANRKNTVIYNSNQNSTIAGANSSGVAFSYGNLRLSSTGIVSKSLAADITVRGNLTIDGAAAATANTLDFNGRNIRLSGDWNTGVNALFIAGGATTVTFDGNFQGLAAPTAIQVQFQTLTLRPTTANNRFANIVIDNPFNVTFSVTNGTALRIANVAGNMIRLTGQATFSRGHVGGTAGTYPHPVITNASKLNRQSLVAGDITNVNTAIANPLMHFEATATAVGTANYNGLGANQASDNSHVVGAVRKTTTAGQSFTFPVGSGLYFAPAGLVSPNATGSEFSTLYIPLNPFHVYTSGNENMVNLSHVSSMEFWQIDRVSGSANTQVLLGWETNRSIGVNIPTDIRVAHYGNTVAAKWNNRGTTGIIGASNTLQGVVISSDVIGSFSPFTLGSMSRFNILPVTLLDFNAKPKDKKSVEVTWKTSEEKGNAFFTIEKSIDGVNFVTYSIVPSKAANGNSQSILSYTELDTKPYNGVSYYRLKQTDIDGKVSYSKIVMVRFDGEGVDVTREGFIVFPNPTNHHNVNLRITEEGFEKGEVLIVDMLGRIVFSTNVQKGQDNVVTLEFNQALPSGEYVLRLATENQVYNCKFIVE